MRQDDKPANPDSPARRRWLGGLGGTAVGAALAGCASGGGAISAPIAAAGSKSAMGLRANPMEEVRFAVIGVG